MKRPSISFTVHGKAIAKGSMRMVPIKGRARPMLTSDAKGLKQWEQTIRGALQAAMAMTPKPVLMALFDAPVALGIRFHMPRPKKPKKTAKHYPTTRPDSDKLARSVCDALQTVVFRDDAQVVALQVRKVYADSGAKVEIVVESWDERRLI